MEQKEFNKEKLKDKMFLCNLLYILNENKTEDYSEEFYQQLCLNITNFEKQIELNYNDLDFEKLLTGNSIDKFLVINIYLLNNLKRLLMESNDALNVLSVQQNKIVRDALKELIAIGIRFNLQPKLPQRINPPKSYKTEATTITTDYNRLCYTTKWLIGLLPCDILRPLIVLVGFESILNALYQIIYCPLKKPYGEMSKQNSEIINEEMYISFVKDKEDFKKLLKKCEDSIPKSIYVKETMLLLKSECIWFKKAVSQQLTTILRSHNGLRTIINSLLENSRDYDLSDSSKSWRALDVIVKLVCSLRSASDFENNICVQIRNLVNFDDTNGKEFLPFEMIFVSCMQVLYKEDFELCQRQFLSLLFEPILKFIKPWEFQDGEDVTEIFYRNFRMLKMCCDNDNDNELSKMEICKFTVVIFELYNKFTLKKFDDKLISIRDTMIEILKHFINENSNEIFDGILFSKSDTQQFYQLRSDLSINLESNKIFISLNPQESKSFGFLAHSLLKFINSFPKQQKIDTQIKFLLYLLSCLINKEKYFSGDSTEVISRNFIIYKLLSSLVEDDNVQQYITKNPKEIVSYISNVLNSIITRNTHKYSNESKDFRTIFLLIMIIQALVSADNIDSGMFRLVLDPLHRIRAECANEELSTLVTSVISTLQQDADNDKQVEGKAKRPPKAHAKEKSELDKAIDDICDPLLPVRAHGLMILAKLIEEKHPEALERKMFVLNIFQQNMKNQESFIYLSAINGLAVMGDLFPDTVLETLTDEYVGFDQTSSESKTPTNDNILEMRMKLGEVLIKVTRNLGDRAPKYKSLLINTFMVGIKDDDYLIRASSLSNLGEVCQVLGYKLGPIVTDVLECIHTVISEDPAVEARRAAVTVIRQLFIGLRDETLSFLQDEIRDLYKTLKRIYIQDEDNVMRLQAQLALEELEVNIKDFLFSNKLQEVQQKGTREKKGG